MAAQGNRVMIDGLLTDVRSSWQAIDELFGSLGPNDWGRPHGADWTMADPPYHLAYFDKAVVAEGIQKGPDLPKEQQHVWRNFRGLNEWNARKFAERSSGQTPQRSLEQMQATREAILDVTRSMTDGDLERPVFIPICGCGWPNAGMALYLLNAHTWNHATELKLHLEKTSPTPSASCTVAEEHAQTADLVMTQSPDTFVKMFTGMADPMSLIQSGELKVQGMEHLPTYGSIFPAPDPDRDIDPMSPPAP